MRATVHVRDICICIFRIALHTVLHCIMMCCAPCCIVQGRPLRYSLYREGSRPWELFPDGLDGGAALEQLRMR